jgi:hypothetical protein
MINEILYLGNEAAMRREEKFKTLSQTRGKPLALEYICDRVDTDDPISGFTVRTEAEGWLQGYITTTTFTIWQKWFRWDSVCGIPPGHPTDEEEVDWLEQRIIDERSKLGAELADQVHDGDPDGEGVIWPHVAEVSLLGALGCGSFLLQLVLTKLEEPGSPYDYCVLQASENAVEFYEKNGYVVLRFCPCYFELFFTPPPPPPSSSSLSLSLSLSHSTLQLHSCWSARAIFHRGGESKRQGGRRRVRAGGSQGQEKEEKDDKERSESEGGF